MERNGKIAPDLHQEKMGKRTRRSAPEKVGTDVVGRYRIEPPTFFNVRKMGVSIGKRRSLGKTSVSRQTSIDRAVPTRLGVQQGRESRPPGKCQAQGGDHKVDPNLGGTQTGEQWYLGQGLGNTLGRPGARAYGHLKGEQLNIADRGEERRAGPSNAPRTWVKAKKRFSL